MDDARPVVLVVDDVRDAADSTAELLAHWGYDAEARYCGASGLAAAHARPPAAVVLDIGMVPMDGFAFTARLRRQLGREDTPVVAVSGHTTEPYRTRARGLGIDHYLLKPADPGELRDVLAGLVAGRPARPTPRKGVPGGFAVRSLLEARPGKEPEVEELLHTARALIEREPGTTAFYAVKLGASTYGTFGTFPDAAARDAHVHGPAAREFSARLHELLVRPPDTVQTTTLAAKPG